MRRKKGYTLPRNEFSPENDNTFIYIKVIDYAFLFTFHFRLVNSWLTTTLNLMLVKFLFF